MTALEFRQLFNESGVSHVEVAQKLELDEIELLRYQIGTRPIPPLVEYAVLWIIKSDQAQSFFAGN